MIIQNYKHYFTETWKDIPQYEELYQVSNLGNIKSLNYNNTGKEQILKPRKNKDGYLMVHLYKNGKRKMYRLHRLIWQAFNGSIPEGYEVNHLSEDKTQNNLDNLNLMTHKENMNFGSRTERAAKANTNGKCSKPVIQYNKQGNLIKEWPSIMEVERSLGFDRGNISKCCLGKLKSAYGFKWQYEEIEKAA